MTQSFHDANRYRVSVGYLAITAKQRRIAAAPIVDYRNRSARLNDAPIAAVLA
jgi:hypothetical protein